MARKRQTKTALWQQKTEAEALEHFERSLGELPDPRQNQGIRYSLHTVVVTAASQTHGNDTADR